MVHSIRRENFPWHVKSSYWAYSGGLDTSVAVKWINETYDMDVIAYTCDLGQGQDIEAIRQNARRTGAIDAVAEDVRNLFIDYFGWPSLMAGGRLTNEGKYLLATVPGSPADRSAHGPVGLRGTAPWLWRTAAPGKGNKPGPL